MTWSGHHFCARGVRWPALLLGVSVAVRAAAEPPASIPPPPPPHAIELTVSAGYAHSPGGYAGAGGTDAAEGVASDLGLGIRTGRWSTGLVGQYGNLSRNDGDELSTAKAGLGVTYHFLPASVLDPWMGGSAGYRFVRASGMSVHGFEVLRVTLGCDLRASQVVAVGPMAGLGLDVFPWLEPSAAGTTSAALPRWYATAFVGVQGRFDLSPTSYGD